MIRFANTPENWLTRQFLQKVSVTSALEQISIRNKRFWVLYYNSWTQQDSVPLFNPRCRQLPFSYRKRTKSTNQTNLISIKSTVLFPRQKLRRYLLVGRGSLRLPVKNIPCSKLADRRRTALKLKVLSAENGIFYITRFTYDQM